MPTLYDYASNGDLPGVQAAITSGANVNAKRIDGTTPLFVASQNGHKEIVAALIAAGANVNAARIDGTTPLFVATQNGHKEIAAALIAAGADVDIARDDGATALHEASLNGHKEIVAALIGASANVNAIKDDGATALHEASLNGHKEIVAALIGAGANVNAIMDDGATALHEASLNGHTEIVAALIGAGANVNAAKNGGKTPLYIASHKGHKEIVTALIAAGANINKISYNGKSVLKYAKESYFAPEINALIIRSASPATNAANAKKWKGFTRSDLAILDSVFDTTAVGDARPPAENVSVCPVCLKYATREAGCKYMKHTCAADDGYRHSELYEKYKNEEGMISWCTVCGRICAGHRHYALRAAVDEKAPLVTYNPGANFFSGDCRGAEGGGGLDEKLMRFRRLREYALDLQDDVDKKTHEAAMNELVEETWNAPLARIGKKLATMKVEKKFNVSLNEFPANAAPAPNASVATNAPNVPRPNANTLKPVVLNVGEGDPPADNTVGYAVDGRVIYFRHKNKNNATIDHRARGEGIGEGSLVALIQDYVRNFGADNFGKCPFDDDGGSWLFPEEVRDVVPAELYEAYRKRFNAKMATLRGAGGAGAGVGGRRKTRKLRHRGGAAKEDVFKMAENAVCVLPPRKSGGKRRTIKKNAKHSMKRSSNRHSWAFIK